MFWMSGVRSGVSKVRLEEKLIESLPSFPFLVVIITTPLAAAEP